MAAVFAALNLQGRAKQPTIGKVLDDAMVAIERDNRSLQGVLPEEFARPNVDKQWLAELIDLIGGIGLDEPENRAKDILGRVYEYFLAQVHSEPEVNPHHLARRHRENLRESGSGS